MSPQRSLAPSKLLRHLWPSRADSQCAAAVVCSSARQATTAPSRRSGHEGPRPGSHWRQQMAVVCAKRASRRVMQLVAKTSCARAAA